MQFVYYVYAYLRKDLTPYLVGKGKDNRAFVRGQNHYPPKNKSHIVFLQMHLSEDEAHSLEKIYIKLWGRKDLCNGILNNLTDGGEGVSGSIVNDELKIKRKIHNKMRVLKGTHNFQTRLDGTNIQIDKILAGTHHFIANNPTFEQLRNKTHAFLGGELQRKRVIEGTHPFLGGEIQRKRLAAGTHHFLRVHSCPRCGKSGKGPAMHRYHFDNCRYA